SLLPKKLFRIRMSRNFGMKMLTMTNLSTECLIQLTKLGYDATPFNQILKQNAKREMRLRLGKVTVADVLAAQPVTTNLDRKSGSAGMPETDLVCRLLLEKKKNKNEKETQCDSTGSLEESAMLRHT